MYSLYINFLSDLRVFKDFYNVNGLLICFGLNRLNGYVIDL